MRQAYLTRRSFLGASSLAPLCNWSPAKAGHNPPTEWSTPEKFGAIGDGVQDDSEALKRLSIWLTSSPNRGAMLRGSYRSGRRTAPSFTSGKKSSFAKEGALTLLKPLGCVLFFDGGEILLDNLNDKGSGDQYHGIYVGGPGRNITIHNPRITWLNDPATRSQGDGIRLYGFPSDSELGSLGDGKIEHVIISGSEVSRAPQAGLVAHGVSDLYISDHASYRTKADGLHLNACRRVTVGAVTGRECGDDVCAFVTYASLSGAKEGKIPGVSPYALPSLGGWSNSDSKVKSISATNCSASALRLAGALNIHVDKVVAQGCQQAVISDGGLAGAGFGWTNAQSVKCTVEAVAARNCSFGIRLRSFGPDPGYNRGDIRVGEFSAEDCHPYGLLVEHFSGFKMSSATLKAANVQFFQAQDVDIGKLSLVDSKILVGECLGEEPLSIGIIVADEKSTIKVDSPLYIKR